MIAGRRGGCKQARQYLRRLLANRRETLEVRKTRAQMRGSSATDQRFHSGRARFSAVAFVPQWLIDTARSDSVAEIHRGIYSHRIKTLGDAERAAAERQRQKVVAEAFKRRRDRFEASRA